MKHMGIRLLDFFGIEGMMLTPPHSPDFSATCGLATCFWQPCWQYLVTALWELLCMHRGKSCAGCRPPRCDRYNWYCPLFDAWGGTIRRLLYNHVQPFPVARQADDSAYVVDHFFVKRFRIAETMQTDKGRTEAYARVAFMKQFLQQFGSEIGVPYEYQ